MRYDIPLFHSVECSREEIGYSYTWTDSSEYWNGLFLFTEIWQIYSLFWSSSSIPSWECFSFIPIWRSISPEVSWRVSLVSFCFCQYKWTAPFKSIRSLPWWSSHVSSFRIHSSSTLCFAYVGYLTRCLMPRTADALFARASRILHSRADSQHTLAVYCLLRRALIALGRYVRLTSPREMEISGLCSSVRAMPVSFHFSQKRWFWWCWHGGWISGISCCSVSSRGINSSEWDWSWKKLVKWVVGSH